MIKDKNCYHVFFLQWTFNLIDRLNEEIPQKFVLNKLWWKLQSILSVMVMVPTSSSDMLTSQNTPKTLTNALSVLIIC